MSKPTIHLPKALAKAVEIVVCVGGGFTLIIGSVYAIHNGVAILGSGPDAALASLLVWMLLAFAGVICIRLPFDF